MILFWDVDTQRDFMDADGRLAIAGAEIIRPHLQALTEYARKKGLRIVASACDHSLDDPEISEHPDFHETFPPHCLRGTPGQQKIPETSPLQPLYLEHSPEPPHLLEKRLRAHDGEIVIHKKQFDVFTNPNTETLLQVLQPRAIAVYGVALDVCDKAAIEGFLQRAIPEIILVEDATRAIREEERGRLLTDWAEQGVKMLRTRDVLDGELLPGG